MGFGRYVTARVLWAGVVSLIITTITFFLVSAAPNPAVQEAATQAALQGGDPAAAAERARELRGLDQPLYVRYMDFIEGVYTLDWGWSRSRSQPVTQALGEGLYYTAQYSVPWTILTVLIGPVVGVYSAANMYSWKDHAATGFAFFGYAIPNFFFGIILLFDLRRLAGGYPDRVQHGRVGVQRTERRAAVGTGVRAGHRIDRRGHARVAQRVGGVPERRVHEDGEGQGRLAAARVRVPRHAADARALSTTLVGQLLALFLGSSLLVEVVFGIPGIGRVTYNALIAQDTNLLLGSTLAFTFIAVIGNLLEDLVFTVLDPRISFDDR